SCHAGRVGECQSWSSRGSCAITERRHTAHQLPDGTPAVVTYDPAYLLRAPEAKAAAWADLCRGLAHVRAASSPAAPA
ncbi:hypothetical protein C7Y68_19960, partial [Paracidovorax avenae]